MMSEKEGYSYTDKDGKICMIRCLKCKRENYILAVSSGMCAWCGYDANESPMAKDLKEFVEVLKVTPLKNKGNV
jgi:ribosomal protein L37E